MHFVSGATSLNLLPLTLPSYFFCHLSSAFSSGVLRFSLSSWRRVSPGSSAFSFSHGGFLLRMTAGGLSGKVSLRSSFMQSRGEDLPVHFLSFRIGFVGLSPYSIRKALCAAVSRNRSSIVRTPASTCRTSIGVILTAPKTRRKAWFFWIDWYLVVCPLLFPVPRL